MQVLAWSLAVAFAYLVVVTVVTIAAALRAGGRREEEADTRDAVTASRITAPVSIVVPAGSTDASALQASVAALLELAYPEFEVIVVAETAAGGAVDALSAEWDLEAREFFFRQTLDAAAVRRIRRSQRDPRLMVVETRSGARADLLNCGVNLARFRFVAVVPPGITFDRTALLRAMAPALADPGSVVGVGSHVERVPTGEAGGTPERFERLQSFRDLMRARIFWAERERAVGPDQGVYLWRRDALLQANGFSRTAASPELDMMFRLQAGVSREERRIVQLARPFGSSIVSVAGSARTLATVRQRAALQALTTWSVSSPLALGRGLALFLHAELAAPLAQGWLMVGSVAGALAGWFSWTAPVTALLVLAFGNAALSAAAVLLRGAHPGAPGVEEVRALLLLAPLETLLRGPGRLRARLAALLPDSRPADLPSRP